MKEKGLLELHQQLPLKYFVKSFLITKLSSKVSEIQTISVLIMIVRRSEITHRSFRTSPTNLYQLFCKIFFNSRVIIKSIKDADNLFDNGSAEVIGYSPYFQLYYCWFSFVCFHWTCLCPGISKSTTGKGNNLGIPCDLRVYNPIAGTAVVEGASIYNVR